MNLLWENTHTHTHKINRCVCVVCTAEDCDCGRCQLSYRGGLYFLYFCSNIYILAFRILSFFAIKESQSIIYLWMFLGSILMRKLFSKYKLQFASISTHLSIFLPIYRYLHIFLEIHSIHFFRRWEKFFLTLTLIFGAFCSVTQFFFVQ